MSIRQNILMLPLLLVPQSSGWAGSTRVILSTYPNVVAEKAKISIEAVGIGKKELESGADWDFSFEGKASFSLRINLQTVNTPPNYSSSRASFDIPYFWGNDVDHELVISSSSEDISEAGLREFVTDMITKSSEFTDLMIAHDRASILWSERLRQLKARDRYAPNADDIKVAYWLLSTTRDLVIQHFYVVDANSRSAVLWTENIIKIDPHNARLFNSYTASVDEFKALISTIEARDAFYFNKIIQHLNTDYNMNPDIACKRINELDRYFGQLDDDNLQNKDGQFNNSVLIKSANVVCKTRLLQQSGAVTGGLIEDAKQTAKNALEIVRDASHGPSKSGLREATVGLKARVRELQKLVR